MTNIFISSLLLNTATVLCSDTNNIAIQHTTISECSENQGSENILNYHLKKTNKYNHEHHHCSDIPISQQYNIKFTKIETSKIQIISYLTILNKPDTRKQFSNCSSFNPHYLYIIPNRTQLMRI
jgi:hypothetical protein